MCEESAILIELDSYNFHLLTTNFELYSFRGCIRGGLRVQTVPPPKEFLQLKTLNCRKIGPKSMKNPGNSKSPLKSTWSRNKNNKIGLVLFLIVSAL